MHVRNTTNRDCHVGYQHGLQLAGFYDIRDEDDESYGPQDEVGTWDDFQGDVFGKYDEGDFEWPDDNDDSMRFSLSLSYNHLLISMTIQWILKTPILMHPMTKGTMRMEARTTKMLIW